MQFEELNLGDGNGTTPGRSAEKVSIYNFLPVALLGEGSYGQVYLVEDINTNQKYAMKKLDKDQVLEQNMMRYT